MIGIFNNKTTKADLTLYNGEYILDTVCTSYEITEELNGEYSFDGNFLISDKINKNAYDLLVNDSLLKVDDEYGIEYFRIAKVTKTKTKYEIFARHITISEPLKMFCEDVRPTNLNGQNAISWIFNNSRGNKWIEVTSNIANINTAYYKNKTVYEALFDSDNSFLNRWGGEVYRRGFRLSINTKVGEDRGFSIRSGKNLKGIEERSSLNTLVTSIYPVGFDGISIPEKCIDSSLINYYSDIYPKEVKFDDVKVKSENNEEGFDTLEEAQEELRKRAKEMFTKDKVDILTSSYTVTFAELQKAEGYKKYSFLETTFLGDIVSVFEEKLGIDIKVRVTKRVYDGIKKRRKSTTLSNKDLNYKPPSITQIIEKINKVDSTETILQLAKDNATALIKSGLKNSHVIVRENEIIIGDTKDINTMTKVWRFNNNGLGYSSTGYFGEYGLAMTQDGAIVADFITTGILNADLIKTGMIKSRNLVTSLNMETGVFTNVVDGFGVEMARGGFTFATMGEEVAGIRSSRFESDNSVNGLSLVNTRDGDYIDLGYIKINETTGKEEFFTMFRVANTVKPQTNNFRGVQLIANTMLRAGSSILFHKDGIDSLNWGEIYKTVSEQIAIFGDTGVNLGYKDGANNVSVVTINETPNAEGNQVFIYKPLSMFGNTIKFASDIFTGNTTGRYLHEGWCGTIQKIAKRVSNLNVSYESGWYAFSSGTNGAPCNYGVMLNIKWGDADIADGAQLVIEIGTGRLFTRATTNNGANWSAWVEK